MQCHRCAMPNPYWKPRCARCDHSLHSWGETVLLAIALLGVPLVALLILS
jgi:hypothetical protein